MVLASGCVAAGSSAGTLEVGAGESWPDIADAGPYPTLALSGAVDGGDTLTGAAGEWSLQVGRASAHVDADELGLFNLEADIVRAGLGLRLGTRRAIGLDWSLGLGACVTVVTGRAVAADEVRSVNEGGLGAYAALTVGRGPLFLRATYVAGPEADVHGYDVELGGLSLTGGLQWSF
jgi:hypothetical protein